MDPKNHRRGILFIAFACLCWSTVGAFVKFLQLPAPTLIFFRSMIAGVFILFYTHIIERKKAFIVPNTLTAWLVILSTTGSVICFIFANKFTTSANAIFLQFVSVPIVVLSSILFFKEKLTMRNGISFTLCVIGLTLFFSGGLSAEGMLGNALAMFAGVWLSIYALALNKGHLTHTLPFSAYGILLAGVLMLPFIPTYVLTPLQMGSLLYLGIFQIGLATILYTKGSRLVSAQELALYGLLEPILNPVWTFLLVREIPSKWAMAGATLIILALLYKAQDTHPKITTAMFD